MINVWLCNVLETRLQSAHAKWAAAKIERKSPASGKLLTLGI
jgi:hypothetical protein